MISFGEYRCLMCSRAVSVLKWERRLLFWRHRGNYVYYGIREQNNPQVQRHVFIVLCETDVEYAIKHPEVSDLIIEDRIRKHEAGH